MTANVKAGFRAIPVEKSYTRKCLNATLEGTYVVEHIQEGVNVTYVCMEFYLQSKSVVLLRHSPSKTDIGGVFCDRLYTEQWPMVAQTPAQGQPVSVGFTHYVGGYTFQLTSDGNVQGCDATQPSPVIELGCLSREDITIDFHTTQCIPEGLLMAKRQNLKVLGVWEQYNYAFFVLRAKNSPNFWCARLTKTDVKQDQMEMVLFLDLVCDPTAEFTEGQNRMIFTMSRLAGSNRSPQLVGGKMDEALVGSWLLMDGQTEVNFTTSGVHFPDQGHYECVTEGKMTKEGVIRVPLHSDIYDGCLPKATCMEVGLRTATVAYYRLGQMSSLPKNMADYEDPYSDFCSDETFDLVDSPSTRFKHVIKATGDLIDKSVDCNVFEPHPLFNFYTVKDGIGCYGNIRVPCSIPSELSIQGTNTECDVWGEARKMTSHVCLASFAARRNGRVLISSAEGATGQFSCWVFTASRDLFYLPGTDCDEDTAYRYELTGETTDSMLILSLYDVPHTCTTTTPKPKLTTNATVVSIEEGAHPKYIRPEDIPFMNFTFNDQVGSAASNGGSILLLMALNLVHVVRSQI